MKKETFEQARKAMESRMEQSVHDVEHVYRVLWAALRIAKTEPEADVDVVILAALLHDIGRAAEEQKGVGHAEAGAAMAFELLPKLGVDGQTAAHVRDCVYTHSYKAGRQPKTLEAKILFDADKLDLAGAVGAARALLFGAEITEPFYLVGEDGLPTPGKPDEAPSFYREYQRKLRRLHTRFYTQKGKEMAKKRQKAMDSWFKAFKKEINGGYKKGLVLLEEALEP